MMSRDDAAAEALGVLPAGRVEVETLVGLVRGWYLLARDAEGTQLVTIRWAGHRGQAKHTS